MKALAAAVLLTAVGLAGCQDDRAVRLEATIVAQGAAMAALMSTVQAPTATVVPSAVPTAVPTLSAGEVLTRVAPSVVRIHVGDGGGTGFVYLKPSQVLTAFHVIGSADVRPVVFTSQGARHEASVLGADEASDLALLSVPGIDAPPLPTASEIAVGSGAFAVGYSALLSGAPSVTKGIVSGKRTDTDTGVTFIQTDAPLNPGNSGGPLLNERGQVIGLNVFVIRGTKYEGMGFALSTSDLVRMGERLERGYSNVLATPTATAVPPTPTPYTVRSYLEQQNDGSVAEITQWSDGKYTKTVVSGPPPKEPSYVWLAPPIDGAAITTIPWDIVRTYNLRGQFPPLCSTTDLGDARALLRIHHRFRTGRLLGPGV